MTPEDIGDIFQALEDALFAMAIRTIKHHQNWEEEEGFKWTQWQAEQIQGLRAYRQNVSALTNYHFNLAKKAIEAFLREAYEGSVSDATDLIARYGIGGIHPGFFGVNSKKLDILIDEAIQNIDAKRYAAINRMNSGYTDFLRKADMFAQSGSFTISQVIDMAAKDFLSAGLNCVEYSNGNRVNIASYAEMALRTSSSEVTRQANGDVRNELGEYLVISNVIAMTCPICQRWQGKVMIDDVYSDGKPDGVHKLVSESKANGFMHPNCRHQLFMYIEGVTKVADLPNDVQTRERYDAEQKQRYYERQIRKYKRLREGAVDPANRQKYDARVKEWTERHDKFLEDRDYLRKNPKRLAPGYTGNGKPEVFTRRKRGPSGYEIIDKPTYQKVTESFRKNGGIIIRGKDAERHLERVGATAAYIAGGSNIAFIRDDATVSDVLEEMFHYSQDVNHSFGSVVTNEVRLRREIEAQEYLISVADQYKIPVEERLATQANLLEYRQELEELLYETGNS